MTFPSLKNLSSTRYLIHRVINRFILANLQREAFGVVVDIGAGKSPYRKFITAKQYICLDIENRTDDPNVIIADINEPIPLADNYADCVICTEVLEHIKKPYIAMSEFYRILKPGGKLILTTPMVWPLHEVPFDFYRYTRYGLEYLLYAGGFVDFTIRPSNTYGYTLAQLAVAYMRRPWQRPIVMCLNIFGILANRIGRMNLDLPLGNQIIAHK